jgi:choloylglycine hydrolase
MLLFVVGLMGTLAVREVFACTGITLKARDGAVLFGRSMEWGTFDLQSRVVIVPREQPFAAHTPDHKPGITWKGTHGFAALDAPALGEGLFVDGMNEKGLSVNGFYHPGFAEYQAYNPAQSGISMGPGELIPYLLSTCATVDEARAALAKVRVTPVVADSLGIAPPGHWMVTEPGGKAIVVEYLKGELAIFDAPLGVITNAPSYDWHEINLRNYLNLSPVALPSKKLADMNFAPLGGGSGMIGLPGDFTPPSRFVRAVAFTQSARKTVDGAETMYELFRILDNFNLPLGSAEGEGDAKLKGMRSSTIWTTAWDTKNLVLYYHTQHNRRVRKVDMSRVDFGSLHEQIVIPLDKVKQQDIDDVSPAGK